MTTNPPPPASPEPARPIPPAQLLDRHAVDTTRESVLVEYGRQLGPDPTLAAVTDAELEQDVRRGAAELAAATCRWLGLVGELVVRGIWADQHCHTPSAWLSWAVGIAPSTARQHVRVALRLRECPRIRDRFASGTLSYSKVRALTRVATPGTEEALLRHADAASAAQLERIITDTRRLERCSRGPSDRDDLGVTRRWRDDGSYEIVIRGDAATGVEWEQRLDRLVDLDRTERARRTDHRTDRTEDVTRPSERQRLAALLMDAVVRTLEDGPADSSGTARHTVVVTAEAADVLAAAPETDPAGSPGARSRHTMLRSGRGRARPVPLRQLWRLACAARLELTVTTDGTPAGLGRTRRDPDARLRRLLWARDRGCAVPGCGAVRGVHAHHVRWWSQGGATDLDNLVLLCSFHHHRVHDHGLHVQPTGDGRFAFHDREGADPRPPARPLPGDPAEALARAARAHLPADTVRALQPDHYDTAYDHSLTVGLLAQRLAAAA